MFPNNIILYFSQDYIVSILQIYELLYLRPKTNKMALHYYNNHDKYCRNYSVIVNQVSLDVR